MEIFKKRICALLSVCVILSMFTFTAVPFSAEEGVSAATSDEASFDEASADEQTASDPTEAQTTEPTETASETQSTPDEEPTAPSTEAVETSEFSTEPVSETEEPKIKWSGDFQYEDLGDSCRIVGYRGDPDTVYIPDYIGSLPVYYLGKNLFMNTGIREVILSDNLLEIGFGCFAYCENLESVSFGAELTSIGNLAFAGCRSLNFIELPDYVGNIGSGAFMGCGFDYVFVNDGVWKIGDQAFGYSQPDVAIEGFTIEGYLDSAAKDYAEDNGFTFRNANERDDYFYFDDYVFAIDSDTKSARLTGYFGDDSVLEIPEELYVLKITAIEGFAFNNNLKLKKVVIPEGVTEISGSAFVNCKNLKEVVLPSTIEKIGADAFSGCTKLSVIEFNGTAEEWGRVEIDTDNEILLGVEPEFKSAPTEPLTQPVTVEPTSTAPTVTEPSTEKQTTPTVKKTAKKANTIKAAKKNKTVKAKKLKLKKLTVKVFTIKNAKGKVTYKKLSGSKYLKLTKKGKITVRKNTPKGKYKIKVRITAKGNSKYKPKALTKTVTIRVK